MRLFLYNSLQGSYVGSGKVVGQVTATDGDSDDKDSVYGRIKYEFVNQSSEYTKPSFFLLCV